MLGISALAKQFFGSANERKIKPLWAVVAKINALEPRFQAMSNDELKAMTPEERQAWVKEHPELAKKIMPAMREGASNATPAPKDKLREKSNDIFERLSPEDREKLEKRRAEQK